MCKKLVMISGNSKNLKKKIIYIFLCIIIIFIISLPEIVRFAIIKKVPNLLDRTISIKDIDINLFSGNFVIKDFAIYEKNNKDIFVGFKKLTVNIFNLKLLIGKIDIEKIQLDSPVINIYLTNKKFNFDDLKEKFTKGESSAASKKNKIDMLINNINISSGIITFRDRDLNANFEIDNLRFNIPIFAGVDKEIKLSADFLLNKVTNIQSEFRVISDSGDYSGFLKLENFQVSYLFPYLKNFINISGISGNTFHKINFTGNFKKNNLITSSENKITDFNLTDKSGVNQIITFSNLELNVKKFDLSKNYLDIEKIDLTKPELYFELSKKSNSFSDLIMQKSNTEAIALTSEKHPNSDTDVNIAKRNSNFCSLNCH